MTTPFHDLNDRALETKIASLKVEAERASRELERRQAGKKIVASMGAIIDVSSVPMAENIGERYRYVRAAIDGNGKPVVLFSMNTRHWTGGALVNPNAASGAGAREIEINDPAYDAGTTIHYHEGK